MITNPVDNLSGSMYIVDDTAKRFPAVLLGQMQDKAREPYHLDGSMHTYSAAIYSYKDTREINTLIVGRAVTGIGAFV